MLPDCSEPARIVVQLEEELEAEDLAHEYDASKPVPCTDPSDENWMTTERPVPE